MEHESVLFIPILTFRILFLEFFGSSYTDPAAKPLTLWSSR